MATIQIYPTAAFPLLIIIPAFVNGLTPELTSDLAFHLHTRCIYIITSSEGLNEKLTILLLQYHLFGKGIETSVINISTAVEENNSLFCNSNRPLFILLSLDQSTRSILAQEWFAEFKHSGTGLNDVRRSTAIYAKDFQNGKNTRQHITRVNVVLDERREIVESTSFRISLTGPIWLVFLDKHTLSSSIEHLNDIYIPFDCEFLLAVEENDKLVSLTEVYNPDRTLSQRSLKWGSWEPALGLSAVPLSLYSRRADLFGTTLRVAAGHDPPYDYLIKDKYGAPVAINGYSSEVWRQLEARLNFSSVIYEARDNEWGSIENNGSWSGMMGMLVNNEVDAAINSFIITAARATAVDFLTPLVTSWTSVFIKEPEILDSKWNVFLAPFTFSLWISLICLMTFVAVGLYLMGRVYQNYYKYVGKFEYSLHSTMYWIWGTFCNQGHSVTPQEWSCRILYWTAYITAIAVIAAYSANFMAFLTIHIPIFPFKSLEGILENGKYSFGVLAESGLLTNFQNATDETMISIYKKYLQPNLNSLPKEYEEGIQQICHNAQYAYMESYDTYLLYAHKLPCKILILPEGSFRQHMGLLVSRKSPYRRIFKHKLEEMRMSGFLVRIYRDKWSKATQPPDQPLKRVALSDTIALFYFVGIGVFVSILIFCTEKKSLIGK